MARGLADRAGILLGHAGGRAFARDDAPAAVNLLDRAVALATGQGAALLDLQRELSLALWSLGEVGRAEFLLNGVIEAAGAAGDKRQERHAVLERSAVRRVVAAEEEDDDPLGIATAAIRVFAELQDQLGLARSWHVLASEYRRLGQLGESERASERALEHARNAGDRRAESRCVDSYCTALLYGPAEATEAITRCREMLALAGGTPLLEANVLASLGGLLGMRGQFDEARDAMRRAERMYLELGLRLALAGLTQVAGPVELLAGDPAAAAIVLRRGYDFLHEIGVTGDSDALLAEALYQQGDYAQAAELAAAAVAHTSESGMWRRGRWCSACRRSSQHARGKAVRRRPTPRWSWRRRPTRSIFMRTRWQTSRRHSRCSGRKVAESQLRRKQPVSTSGKATSPPSHDSRL